jgi:hypothetical protein
VADSAPKRRLTATTVDESFIISFKRGNTVLRREVWVDRMGRVEHVEFISFEDIEARFEREWAAIGGTK